MNMLSFTDDAMNSNILDNMLSADITTFLGNPFMARRLQKSLSEDLFYFVLRSSQKHWELFMNILVLDEDKAQLETIGRGLFLYGHQAIMAASFEEAYQCVSTANDKRPIDLMIIDLSHNGDYRFNIIKEMLEKSPELPVLVIMGINANEEMKKVKELGIPMLKKPFDPNLLNQSITKLMASTPLPAAAADAN